MSAHPVAVFHVGQQNMPQVSLPDHHDMVEAFSADRSYQPLRMPILPWRPWGDGLITDTQRPYATNKDLTVAGIPIADQMMGRRLPAAGFRTLIGKPLCGRMSRNTKPQGPPPAVPHDQQRRGANAGRFLAEPRPARCAHRKQPADAHQHQSVDASISGRVGLTSRLFGMKQRQTMRTKFPVHTGGDCSVGA